MKSWLSLLALPLLLAAPAHATLGGKLDSIDSDRARLAPRSQARVSGLGYTLHEMTLESATTVREYSRSDGTVFAVSWVGPQRPDLQRLFGTAYFTRFQNDNKPTGRIRARRAMASTHSDFVVRTGGHSGALWGMAFLPGMAPAGIDMQTLLNGEVQ